MDSAPLELMVSLMPVATARAQVFHLSPQFQAIEWETRDLRSHPVLGAASSTRIHAYEAFRSAEPHLVAVLARRAALPVLVQLVAERGQPIGPTPGQGIRVQKLVTANTGMPTPGVLSGDERANRLSGSPGDDILLGWSGNDILAGEAGADVLSGGRGCDRFFYGPGSSSPPAEGDTITDFRGVAGDRLQIQGARRYIGAGSFNGRAGEVRFSAGLLQTDRDGNRQADLEITLAGVDRLRAAWLFSAGTTGNDPAC